ncbi:hypothetical protein [Gillisia limnaea]|uniref:PH domain-containing protein n=1 Tax=Gillisia limnaea (strain DSM 15749 / LMG 21470 / R-8282) TaxID=865937 RepID=H2BVV7_GILLR|nr:hypothetical protein [Gillisia limnaea]EHQ01840.1 hypothetical protein Gilli_1168 [Gillisia limnaea DSM 15749]
MTIRFKKKTLFGNLILGLLWTGIGIYNLITDDNLRWSDYIFLGLGILYITHYLYDLINQYLKVETGTIRKNILYGYGKKINLDEINLIKKKGNDYILITESQKLKIKTDLIEETSLSRLKNILKKLNLPSEKTPFANIS